MEMIRQSLEMCFAITVLMMAALVYGIPYIVAAHRNHRHEYWIMAFTFFLGWTGIGWIAALIYAKRSNPDFKEVREAKMQEEIVT